MDETFAFKVVLGSLIIGTLRADKGEWVFTYSDDFRKQSAIKPIVDFPATDREYRSPSLWPFFALRIPSPKQPEVQEFIERMTEDKVNEGILLKEFGIQSIANPFRLVPV
ncbi:MAG TPA: HipA N-terminal domain-containing protein [Sedimentisphaerales bacterium]